MNYVSQQHRLEQLITQLRAMPKHASLVFSEHNALWQSLGFSQEQVALWLASLPQNNQQKEPSAGYQATPDIAAHLVSLLQQAGGRMPLALVLKSSRLVSPPVSNTYANWRSSTRS